jgi:hypothetical protein
VRDVLPFGHAVTAADEIRQIHRLRVAGLAATQRFPRDPIAGEQIDVVEEGLLQVVEHLGGYAGVGSLPKSDPRNA